MHYLQLKTEDLNSKTLATYFQELNFNIIKYCEETYPVQSQYSIDFESETETSHKGKQKLKQHLNITPNTPKTLKTTTKHLQTPKQRTSVKLLLFITLFLILLAQPQTPNSLLNCFFKPEDFQLPKNPTQQQELLSTSTNIIDYLQKNESNPSENLESKETKSEQEETAENEKEIATAYIAKIPKFIGEDNNTSSQKWLDKVQKAGDANDWNAARMFKTIPRNCKRMILDQFIAELKDKLIKKVHSHAPADLATAIRHAKNYKITIEEANHTKLVNLAIEKTSSAAKEKIDQLTKKQYQTPPTQQYQVPARRLVQHNQFTPQNQFSNNNNRINPNNQLVLRNSGQQKPNHYHTQPSYLTMPEGSNFQQTALSEDIFPFEFEANELPFLLSNAVVNEQKAITAMYTEATANANLDWKTQELKILYQGQYTRVPATCGIFNKKSEKVPVFEFKEEKELPTIEIFMALGLTSSWAEETEQEIFEKTRK
ncbi:hypothetical protein G9A89_021803 [Geosiphon pyriformis]|nr:hypothetical protein G9A89_021803 [Geosiphon pyriformis]